MPFPLKFKDLIELTYDEVEKPTSIWINYAVCAYREDSCEWQGWVLDKAEAIRGTVEKVLPSDDHLDCPRCGNPLFRTEVNYRFVLSQDQAPKLIPEVDYEAAPVVYHDDTLANAAP